MCQNVTFTADQRTQIRSQFTVCLELRHGSSYKSHAWCCFGNTGFYIPRKCFNFYILRENRFERGMGEGYRKENAVVIKSIVWRDCIAWLVFDRVWTGAGFIHSERWAAIRVYIVLGGLIICNGLNWDICHYSHHSCVSISWSRRTVFDKVFFFTWLEWQYISFKLPFDLFEMSESAAA